MNMNDFKGLGGNWKSGKTKDSIVTDITHGCDPDLLEYYGGAVVCESIPDEYTKSLLIASPDLLQACINVFELVERLYKCNELDYNDYANHSTELKSAITKALTI